MKIKINKAAMGEAAGNLSRVIRAKNTLPILDNILCELKDGRLTMTASDHEVVMTTTVGVDGCEGDGSFCIPSGDLTTAIGLTPTESVNLTVGDGLCILDYGSGQISLPVADATDYPIPKEQAYTQELRLKGADVREALNRTVWATAANELRPVMCGVYFGFVAGGHDVVGSDGCVLVRSHYRLDNGSSDMPKDGFFILPKKVSSLLCTMLGDEELQMQWNEKWARIDWRQWTMQFRLVVGAYPKYERVIPTDQPKVAMAGQAELMGSLRRVVPFSDTVGGHRLVRMAFSEGQLTLTGEDVNFAKKSTDLLAIDYHGEGIEIGMNGTALMRAIGKMSGELLLRMSEPSKPLTIVPKEQKDGCEVLMLLMPMMLI